MIPDAHLAEARTLMGLGRADAVRGRHTRALAAFDEAYALLGRADEAADEAAPPAAETAAPPAAETSTSAAPPAAGTAAPPAAETSTSAAPAPPSELQALRGRNATLRCFSLRPLGRLAEARAEGRRALVLAAGDLAACAVAEQVYGSAAVADGDVAEGIAAYRRAVSLARAADTPRTEGLTLLNLALALTGTGAYAEAREALDLGRARLADDPFHLGRAALFEGELARAQGALDAAEPCLDAALRTAEADGDIAGALHARVSLVEVALARGDGDRARRGLEDVAGMLRFLDDVAWGPRIDALWEKLGALASHASGARRPRPPQRPAPSAPPLPAGRRASDAPLVTLRLDPEGRHVEIDGTRLDFGRRGPLRRVLVALARARLEGTPLSAAALLDAGWPGERMSPPSGAGRVYTTVRRLRDLGLDRVLCTLDDGYLLGSDCVVEVVPHM